MTTITLSRLKGLGSIDNPQASAMERALMHLIDSRPKGDPDGFITDADITAFERARPGMGNVLDANEQEQLLSIFEKASADNAYNLSLIALARVSVLAYKPTVTDSTPSMRTAAVLPVFTVQADEGVWQVAERVKAELGAQYPAVLEMPTGEIANKILQANGLAMNANGSYPALQSGQVLQIAPYPDGAMERVEALLTEVVKYLPEATQHAVLATLGIGVGIFLATLWLTPGPATVAMLTYLAGALGKAFMVGAGVGLVTLIAGAAMGSGGLSSAYEIKNNAEVGKVGAGMVTALAAPKAVEYTGKAITAATPIARDAIGKIASLLSTNTRGEAFGPFAASLSTIAPPASLSEKSVLLVQGDETSGFLIKTALEAKGFAVEWVQSAEAAIQSLNANPGKYASVVLEEVLPRMANGHDIYFGLPVAWRGRVYVGSEHTMGWDAPVIPQFRPSGLSDGDFDAMWPLLYNNSPHASQPRFDIDKFVTAYNSSMR